MKIQLWTKYPDANEDAMTGQHSPPFNTITTFTMFPFAQEELFLTVMVHLKMLLDATFLKFNGNCKSYMSERVMVLQ